MNDFLPQDYSVPTGPSNYMKFVVGPNKLRILGSPILGYLGWANKKPIRKRMGEDFPVDQVDNPEEIKHFWALPVWNYKAKRVQILELTQKGIMKKLKALKDSEGWGSPVNYDIIVMAEGEGKNREYDTIPSPPAPISDEIQKSFKETPIKLEALFEGKDPFEKTNGTTSEQQTAAPVSAQIAKKKEEVPMPTKSELMDADLNNKEVDVEDIPF